MRKTIAHVEDLSKGNSHAYVYVKAEQKPKDGLEKESEDCEKEKACFARSQGGEKFTAINRPHGR